MKMPIIYFTLVLLSSAVSIAASNKSPANDPASCDVLILSLKWQIPNTANFFTAHLAQMENPKLMPDAMLEEYPEVSITEYSDKTFFVKIGANQYRSSAGDQIEFLSNDASGFYHGRQVLAITPLNSEETILLTKTVYNNGYGKLTTVVELRHRATETSSASSVATFSDVR